MLAAHLFFELNANINPISQDFCQKMMGGPHTRGPGHDPLEENFAHFKVKFIIVVQFERTFTRLFHKYHDHK